jgi:hypothetical protein
VLRIAEHPAGHPIDDDDLTTKLTERAADALEITAVHTR